mmetsp:Transcript_18355/g.27412  ORF Transcript_18355/g.27412 Transcript_18355/m.27412 type:complete len:339 (+) Transcript_18355:116-1132(+)
MSSSSRRPARRTLPTRTKKISMSRQYTSSFSGIDWGGMLSGSLRSSFKPRGSDFSVGLDSIDLPSMSSGGGEGSSVKQSKKNKSGNGSGNNDDDDDEGKSNARGSMLLVEQIRQENEEGGGKRNKKPLWKGAFLYAPTKSKQKVQFDLNGEDDCEEAVMEDGQKIIVPKCGGCDKSRGGCKWCLVFTLLAIVAVVAATVYFIMFPPNTAILYWKKAMNGMRDWKSSSNNNNVVQQQLMVQQQQQQGRGQEMLELAEQIALACGESSLLRSGSSVSSSGSAGGGGGGVDARSWMSSCQELCHNHMCCVEQDDEYSCKNDVTKDCAVYAGCVALIDDNFW